MVATDRRNQTITGVIPPQLDEAIIRQVWPSVARYRAIASLGRLLMRSMILAPLGWLVLALPYFIKVAPGLGRRYVLTNRRLLELRGAVPVSRAIIQGQAQRGILHSLSRPVHEVQLALIDDIRLVTDANSSFYRTANLEVIADGQVVMRLPGVPGGEAFRQTILGASKAWIPGRADTGHFIPASVPKKS